MARVKDGEQRKIYKSHGQDCYKRYIYMPIELDNWLKNENGIGLDVSTSMILLLRKCKEMDITIGNIHKFKLTDS